MIQTKNQEQCSISRELREISSGLIETLQDDVDLISISSKLILLANRLNNLVQK